MTTPTPRIPDRTRQVIVVVGAVIAVVGSFVGSGAVIGTPIAEAAGGAFSATSTLVAPAGPAFSIWSVIYLGLIAYTILQLLPTRTAAPRHRILGIPIAAAMTLNGAWILSVQLGVVWLTVVVIVALLATLVHVFTLIVANPAPTLTDRIVVDGTMGLYLGWVSVATIANTSAWLANLGVDAGVTTWSVVVLVAAVGAASLIAVAGGGRLAPMIAITWGLAWIAQGRLDGPRLNTVTGVVAIAAAVAVVTVTLTVRATTSRTLYTPDRVISAA